MIFIDKMKNMKIYRTPTYLPTIDGNKKKGSVAVMLTPNYNSSKKLMQNPMFINKQRFQSYYLQKDVSYFVNSKVVEEATFNEGYSEYEYLVEMTAAEKNKLKDSDFGLPMLRKYPMPDAAHVRSAIKFFNYVDKKNEAELAKNIKKKAKEFGVDIKVGDTNRLKNYVTESEIISESIHNNPAPVFFLKDISPENILAAYNAMAKSLPAPVACKVHSGEYGNNNFLRPDLWKPLIEYLNGTVVECNTAYEGSRNTTEEHKKTLAKHGWDKLPCEIMDEKGEVELDIPVYNQMNKNYVGAGLLNYNSMVVLSHFKGHAMGGFGGALKQLSIGCASSRGKKIIHGHGDEKLGSDLLNAHTGRDEDVDYKEQIEFTEAMADAASSVHNQFKDNIIYINVLANISKDCDCDAHAAVPSMKDIGILVSNDPVAIDKASIDLIYNSDDPGKDEIIERIESRQGLHIFDACKNIDFGNPDYRLIDLSMLRNIEKNTEKRIDEEEVEERFRYIPEWMNLNESSDDEDEKFTDGMVFDLGGVLLKGLDWKEEIKKQYDYPDDVIDKVIKTHLDNFDESDTATIEDARFAFCSRFDESEREVAGNCYDVILRSWEPFDYVDNVIKLCKKMSNHLYYLSNWSRSGFETLQNTGKLDFLKEFDGGLVSYEVGFQKPDESIYKLFIEKMNIEDPANCIFFDNKEDNVQAARSAGLSGVVFTSIGDIKTVDDIQNKVRPFGYVEEGTKLYHLSQNKNLKTVKAEIPDNYFTKNGYEDDETKRACFAPSIDKCLMALSRKCQGEELYVYVPDGDYDTYKPSKKEVPDSGITGETWIKQDTKVKCIGKIKVIDDAGKDGHEFTYGDKKAELYDWDWKWIVKESFEYIDEHVTKKDEDYKSKGTIDLNSLRAIKLTPGLVEKYQDEYKFLKHIRTDEGCTARIFKREHGDEILCGLCVEEKSDGHKWIQALEVYHDYRGYGLGRQMLDYAVTKLGAEYLSVSKKNQIAIDMYTEYGFKLYKETQIMFFFTLNKDQKYEESKFTNDQAEKTDTDSSDNIDISTEQFLSEIGDVFSTGDTVFMFNEDATSLQLKKYLYADRIRQRKELLTLYNQVKMDNKDIKFTFPDIKKYLGKNLFFDTYYYTELFFRNNNWVLKKGLNLFAEYMNLLNSNITKEVSSYKKITYFIPVLDWSKGGSQIWNYKQTLNPISLIYQYMFTGDIRNLKKMFNNSDVIFVGDKNYFKLNFEEIDAKTVKKLSMKFKLFVTKICLNQEFDPEDIDTTPDNFDSKEVITAKIVDKIEDAKGVDLTAAVAADKAMEKSADKSVADRDKYVASKDSIAKANKVEQELEQPSPDEVVSKGTLNQPKNSDDSKREKDISNIAQGINRAVDIKSDVDSALRVMDNDIDIKQAIIDLDSETDSGTINISAARSARITELDKKLLDTELNGRTIKDILDQEPAELPSISIPVASPNAEQWQNMSFVNFDKGYDIDRDIIRCFRFFENVSRPISIRNISSEDNSTSEDRVTLYTVELEDYNAKRFSIKLDIPIMKDNRFLLRGNSKTIQTQFFNMPILKVDEEVAEIISNYMKIRVIKYNTTPGKSLPITTRLLKALDKYNGRNIKVTPGDNSMICKKYDLPMDYVDIASVIDKIETPIVDFYFSQDEIREKFADKISPRTHQYPIGYNKKVGSIVYWSGNEEYNTITDLIVSWIIASDKNFQEVFEGTMRPSSNTFTKCRLMNAEIPTIVVCAYHEGLRKTLDKANIGYSIVDKITKEIRSDYDSDWIKFSDGYLVYRNTYEASLLLNGLKVCNTEDFSIGSIDNRDMYLSFLDNFGGRIKSDGLDNFYDCMIDPMTEDVLKFYKLPTDYVTILIYASNLLADNKFHKHTDTSTRRLRRYELIASYTYKVLSDAYSKYANECKHGKNGDMIVKQSAVIEKFLTDTITSDDSCINALRDIESTNAITTKGPSGMNKDRAYSLDKRTYDESMLNVLGMSTGFAANTGITRQATLNANVQGEKGYVKNINGDTSKMNTSSSLTATEALIPFGTTHDDPMRTAMSFIQTAKHQVRTEESDPPLVVNGFEEAMPYMSTDRFAFKAKSDGHIEEYVPDEYIVLKYKDGTNDFINLKETIEKNSDGGYFVPLKLDARDNIKAGMKIKEGDILAYDKYSYSSDVGESGNLAYNVGKLAKVAIINSDEGFEDSGIITEKMAKSLATRVVLKFDVILDKDTRIISSLNVGDHVEAGQPVLVWQNPFEEEEANTLIGSLAANSEEVSELGKRRLISEVTGKVSGIKMFRTVDVNELSPTLKKMVSNYEKPIKAIANKINSLQGVDKSIIDAHTTLPPVGKLKKAEDSVLIEYYVEYLDTVGIGDKIVYFAANKATEKSVIPEGKEPRSSFRPNETIDAFVSEVSIDKRIVTSTLINGGLNKLMIELDRSVKDILGIQYDDTTV